MIVLRPMDIADIPAGMALSTEAGWNQQKSEWELFIRQSPGACLVAIADDRSVVGTVATIQYGKRFGWIGMLLVGREHRRKGIGGILLQGALKHLQHIDVVKLDATPEGRQVYLKLGFEDESTINRMMCTSVPLDPGESQATPMSLIDFRQIRQIDDMVFGGDRLPVLEWMWRQAPQYAFVTRYGKGITGYCFGRPGRRFAHIGPVISQDPAKGIALVTAALQNCEGQPAIVDVLSDDAEWTAWLMLHGFVVQRRFIRMRRGANKWPGAPKNQFAILGPEFG